MTKWMAHKGVIFVAHNMSGYDGQFILKKASNKSAPELVYEEEAEKVVEKRSVQWKSVLRTPQLAAANVFMTKKLESFMKWRGSCTDAATNSPSVIGSTTTAKQNLTCLNAATRHVASALMEWCGCKTCKDEDRSLTARSAEDAATCIQQETISLDR
ncbi:hypothetical protein L3Y34_013047 [Caenorhabditis briggsae]|uniref:DNA-directed DNA polymerase n=1 Tax=Caenorhabditis briggsae TaxID=6238 RepID=A0AAE9A0M6_CAEBR|nr:hypothetical protein L3Y34_013047 [Caenorhabditis briggsae]